MKQALRIFNSLKVFEGLAGSLVGIFVPIFLLSSGHGLKEVFVYYLIHYIAVFVFFVLAAWLTMKIGLKQLLVVRYIFWLAWVGILFFIPDNQGLIYALAVVGAISAAFYYFPFHIIFGRSVSAEKSGSNFARLVLIGQVVGFFGPLIAAGVIKFWGYQALFVAALALMASSWYFLQALPMIKTKINFSWAKLAEFWRQQQSYFWLEFVENIIEEVEGIVFPIFVYLIAQEIWSVAAVSMLAGIGSLIFTWLVAGRVDRWSRFKTLAWASLVLAALWVAMYWLKGYWYYGLSLVMGLVGTVFGVTFNALIYVRAKQNNFDEFIIFREIPVLLARVCLYTTMLLWVQNFSWVFLWAALLYVLLALILGAKRKEW